MSKQNINALASCLERVADKMCAQSALPTDNRYIGLEEAAIKAIEKLLTAMFPNHLGQVRERFSEKDNRIWELMRAFDALTHALGYVSDSFEAAENQAMTVISALPEILAVLETDVIAAYEGDPAAQSLDEVILSYPAFKAISIYRLAHKLYEMQVPILPRLMTEHAHRLTGIDIHPGAKIGSYFFIDHGTGVVIGETTTIGEHVKLYQHVTLGAKSFQVGPDSSLVKGIKRHPDIGDYAVIYAGATILGGNTVIGHHCVIGGNVWLTESVAPGQTVTIRCNVGPQEIP
ncbi:serine acetyltransferase [bacterium]|nr:serine acetyltransferase [bacterium]